ncbi:MAG: SDR family oxidoreductase [Polyangiaceae bacterium]
MTRLHHATLDVTRLVDGVRLIVIGGTGFVGKLFWSMLLDRYPNIGRIYLMVRPKAGITSEERFWREVAASEALSPLRRAHGDRFESFLRSKIAPIDGDVRQPLCGVSPEALRTLTGSIDVVINVAGVVDFNPPLDEAIAVNAVGAQNLVALARSVGAAVFHTSTCYVAGAREGLVREEDPRAIPFPQAQELGLGLWDPQREIAECLDRIAQATRRSEDAFRQSEVVQRTREVLRARGEPFFGEAYEAERARTTRRRIADELVEAGIDRAKHWGWPNIYTYTKALGEQVVAGGGLPFVIARPACCESCVDFPFPSYNEGINTSAPLLYMMMKGQVQVLATHVPLDFIPADYVVAGMILALAELLEGTAAPVYHLGASDVNPCTAQRFGELTGLYKRKFFRRGTGHPLADAIQARIEPSFVGRTRFDRFGPPAIASAASEIAARLRDAAPALRPAA